MKITISRSLKIKIYAITALLSYFGSSAIITYFIQDKNEKFFVLFQEVAALFGGVVIGLFLLVYLSFLVINYFKDNITIEK